MHKISAEDSVKSMFMRQSSVYYYAHFDDLQCQALDMRYKDSELSMFVLLPDKRDGLKHLLVQLKQFNLLDLGARIDSDKCKVHLMFPKFKLDYFVKMSSVLKKVKK